MWVLKLHILQNRWLITPSCDHDSYKSIDLIVVVPQNYDWQDLRCIISFLYFFDVLCHSSVRSDAIFIHYRNQLILWQQFRRLTLWNFECMWRILAASNGTFEFSPFCILVHCCVEIVSILHRTFVAPSIMSSEDGINTSPRLRQGIVLLFHLQSAHRGALRFSQDERTRTSIRNYEN